MYLWLSFHLLHFHQTWAHPIFSLILTLESIDCPSWSLSLYSSCRSLPSKARWQHPSLRSISTGKMSKSWNSYDHYVMSPLCWSLAHTSDNFYNLRIVTSRAYSSQSSVLTLGNRCKAPESWDRWPNAYLCLSWCIWSCKICMLHISLMSIYKCWREFALPHRSVAYHNLSRSYCKQRSNS